MELMNTSVFLIMEWIKTLFIFTIIDRILIQRKVIDTLKNHETYLSSLVVAAYLIIARTRDLPPLTFLLGAVIVMIFYLLLRTLFRVFVKSE
ncbi:hypothetical protein Amet_1204 [Alkaliphilus metalliredigens QYMF]|uniref:Uncharacterized protein n=1 Tax=Alkaliphilus metalliredigens (strain QYMF) TaxID=293826 RepID=A6TMJ4_ALKMQ|nr:hypothetical protein [Alkaliphilus metalliredigens]ABR47412.1 hypothetical protein Amet_1204 [Alkaliphilus metalliredigens QYMF]